MNRRIKVYFSPKDIMPVFIGGYWCRSSCPYPADTVVVETYWSELRGAVVMTLEHPTFPPVAEDEEPYFWFRVEEKRSEAPRFGFFLDTEWKGRP